MTKTKRDGTKFNPTVGQGFSNDKFGKGSIKIDLDADGIKAFVENAQVGGSLLIKFHKDTSSGNKFYFAELLPPWTGNNSKKVVSDKATGTGSELD